MAVVKVNFFSEALMRTVNFLAVIPIDKRSVDGQRTREKNLPFKTLYLLHGIYGSEYDWITSTRIRQWAQERNLAVIMPAGENKFYRNQGNTGDNFGIYIGEELVSFTRNMFRLSERREDTYIAGLSMGGVGSLYAGLQYPETFGYIGTFSSALFQAFYPKTDEGYGLAKKRSYMEAVLGPERMVGGSDRDYFLLAKRVLEEGRPMPKIYMSCGLQDELLEANREYRDYLRSLHVELEYSEGEGGHDWIFWDKQIYHLLEWLPLEEKTLGISSGNVL